MPILIDRYGNVVAGEGRLLAARELAMTQVPTLGLDHLTPAQQRAFRISDNRLSEADRPLYLGLAQFGLDRTSDGARDFVL